MKKFLFYDNSRISAYKSCPMQYYIRHKMGLTRDGLKPPLSFGGAWHEGIAEMYNQFKNLTDLGVHPGPTFKTDTLTKSKEAFMKEWYKRGMPDPDRLEIIEQLFPRIPGIAFELLEYYLEVKYDWLLGVKVLEVERPFVVPLFETDEYRIFLIGRKDAVIQTSDGIWAVEHKTTTLKANIPMCKNGQFFQYKFLNMWDMSPQVNGYTYSLKLEYGKKAMGVYILGYLVHKDIATTLPGFGIENMFKTIPVYKSDDALEAWHFDTQHWVKQLIESNRVNYFPHNESGCTHQYGDCEFKNICTLTSDPTALAALPGGYKEEFWEPFDVGQLEKIIREIEGDG
ncbi:MAG: PD-(D/E)XK nuclease family protein [Candidatus Thorarchaeota archaeon]